MCNCNPVPTIIISLALLVVSILLLVQGGDMMNPDYYKPQSQDIDDYNAYLKTYPDSTGLKNIKTVSTVSVQINTGTAVTLTKQSKPRKVVPDLDKNTRYVNKADKRTKDIIWWSGSVPVPLANNCTVTYIIDGRPVANFTLNLTKYNKEDIRMVATKGGSYNDPPTYPAVVCKQVKKLGSDWVYSKKWAGDGCEAPTAIVKETPSLIVMDSPKWRPIRLYGQDSQQSSLTFEMYGEDDPWLNFMYLSKSSYTWPTVNIDLGPGLLFILGLILVIVGVVFLIIAIIVFCSNIQGIMAMVKGEELDPTNNHTATPGAMSNQSYVTMGDNQPQQQRISVQVATPIQAVPANVATASCQHCQFTFQYQPHPQTHIFTCPNCTNTTTV